MWRNAKSIWTVQKRVWKLYFVWFLCPACSTKLIWIHIRIKEQSSVTNFKVGTTGCCRVAVMFKVVILLPKYLYVTSIPTSPMLQQTSISYMYLFALGWVIDNSDFGTKMDKIRWYEPTTYNYLLNQLFAYSVLALTRKQIWRKRWNNNAQKGQRPL